MRLSPTSDEVSVYYCLRKDWLGLPLFVIQIDLLKAFKGDATKLGNAEKFFLEVMDIPRLAERLNCFVYKKEFHSRVAELVAVCPPLACYRASL